MDTPTHEMFVGVVNPVFSDWVACQGVVVELDDQRCEPWPHGRMGDERISPRRVGNLVAREDPSRREREEAVAIRRRVEASFVPFGDWLALQQIRLVADDQQPPHVWRAP